MAKFKFNLNDIHLYEWSDLYWFEYEISIELWALSNLIRNQEDVYVSKQKEFIAKRNEVLPNIPIEHRDSYEQHFFEDSDRTFFELKKIQRNSICLSFYSFLEGKILELIHMMAEEFDVPYRKSGHEILESLNRYIVHECRVNGASFKKSFNRISRQSYVRNAIAHNQSRIHKKRRFIREDGIIQKGNKIVIEDVVYLENLIIWTEEYFKQLLISVDKRLTEIKTSLIK